MKIIAVNRFYGADHAATAPLLADVAERLAAESREVAILTARMRYSDSGKLLPKVEHRNGVKINRIWTTTFGRRWILGRLIDYLSFYVSAFRVLLKNADCETIIIAKTDPPLISVAAWSAAKLKRAKLVNWCQDLFPEVAVACGVSFGNRLIGKIVRATRNLSLRGAEANIVLSQEMADYLERQDVPREKLSVIANWPRPEVEKFRVDASDLRRTLGLEGKTIIGYSGNLGRVHATDHVIDLIERARELDDVVFLFTGGGRGFDRLKKLAIKRDWRHLRFRAYQPTAELPRSLALPDIHLITLDPACEGLVVPSKFYGVLAAGRPCLFLGSEQGHVARTIDELQAGFNLPIDQPERWNNIISALRDDPDLMIAQGLAAQHGYEQFYQRAKALQAWGEVIVRQEEIGSHATKTVVNSKDNIKTEPA